MKTHDRLSSTARSHRAAASTPSASHSATPGMSSSPRMAAQRQQLDASFGAAQRAGPEDELQMKGALQRVEEEETLQGKMDSAASASPQATAPAPNRTGMPDSLKSGIESLSGMDLSEVRVHANSAQPAQLDALAYAQGNDIHLAPGQEQHLPHEAWHVVQQRQGRVQPTLQMAGVGVNDDAGLEAEADAMGAKALQTKGRA